MWRSLLCLYAVCCAAQDGFDVAGRFTPEGRASVTLWGTQSPFTVSTLSDEDGRFSFKKIQPGTYTVAVFLPVRGEARQTVVIGPSNADAKRRVVLNLDLQESGFVYRDAIERRHSISAKQLAIPDKAMREYEQAQKDLSKRDVESATRRLERAVELAPQFAAAWNHLGTIAYQTRQYPSAEKYFREALKQAPNAYEPLVNLGGVLINLRKMDEAWQYNVHAVLTRPNDPLANSQLGQTYFILGRPELAEKYLLAACRLDPAHFSHPQLFLAELYVRRGDKLAAADILAEFLRQHPDWPQASKMRSSIDELRQ